VAESVTDVQPVILYFKFSSGNSGMISVTAAKKIILDHTATLPAKKLSLINAAGLVLAADVFAIADIPAFAQSSMDGYAFSYSDREQNKSLSIKGEMAAGSPETFSLQPGQATRIFTGAPLPPGADTVVMQEKTTIENGRLIIDDEKLMPGQNVRARGSEIKSGALALEKDTLLQPAAVGFLAGIGITEVEVIPAPSVSLIVTGNELQDPGQPLSHGQVYESNSFSLRTALQQAHITEVHIYKATDTLDNVSQVLKIALEQSDIVFLTGGVSVGDYDFVVNAAAQNSVEKIFHKIKQRPGKPFYFGKKGTRLVFGLPGNPASVLTCFYEFAEPALKKMMQQKSAIRILRVPLSADYTKAPGITHFLKGLYNGQTVQLLGAQESYRLQSFAIANCLVRIDEETTECKKGTLTEIHLLPV
jgi:molybdopterin molybdotransferase